MSRAELSGWGRYPVLQSSIADFETPDDAARPFNLRPVIARGNARSYGDSSVSTGLCLDMRKLNRLLAFDPSTGQLVCEAGTLLSDVLDVFVPRGWFPPVAPGTRFVTVGGMIASDVHGKNHQAAGSFCDHVVFFDVALGDGTVLRCSRNENADLFAASCGGMGLTGIILRAAFTLAPIATTRIIRTVSMAANLDAALAIFEASGNLKHSVAWIDCLARGADLGRSILIQGEHAGIESLPVGGGAAPLCREAPRSMRVPFDFPGCAFDLMGWFANLCYRAHRAGSKIVEIDPFFFPLDGLRDWNRIYGRQGFVQYQCVIPLSASRGALLEILDAIARCDNASPLAVLKRLGRASFGLLSFPMEGYTLAVDFPARAGTFALLDRLDTIVESHGGRIYLTKDARMSARMFAATYSGLNAFREVRRRYNLDKRFGSAQSARLEI